MINLINSAADIMHSKTSTGNKYYWILYYNYLSPQQLQNTDEVIEKLKPHITNISNRTYYRIRPKADKTLNSVLCRYTSKECLTALDIFYLKEEYFKKAINEKIAHRFFQHATFLYLKSYQ